MQDDSIHLKSNRQFLINISVALAILGVCAIVGMSICIGFDCMSMQECYQIFIMFIIYSAIMICLALFFKFYRGKSYEFSKGDIKIYNKNRLTETVSISDVESIYFIYFKIHYFITIFAGSLYEGGCWTLHIKLKDGTKKELAFFSKKDAKLLKDKIYGDLLTII